MNGYVTEASMAEADGSRSVYNTAISMSSNSDSSTFNTIVVTSVQSPLTATSQSNGLCFYFFTFTQEKKKKCLCLYFVIILIFWLLARNIWTIKLRVVVRKEINLRMFPISPSRIYKQWKYIILVSHGTFVEFLKLAMLCKLSFCMCFYRHVIFSVKYRICVSGIHMWLGG